MTKAMSISGGYGIWVAGQVKNGNTKLVTSTPLQDYTCYIKIGDIKTAQPQGGPFATHGCLSSCLVCSHQKGARNCFGGARPL